MSFVNLKGSDLWSEADIASRVQSLIRSRYNEQDELKAARLSRKPDATETELTYVTQVDGWIAECVDQGRQARLDTALLAQVLEVERAQNRLAQYRLVDGKPAITEEKPSIDEEGNSVIEVVELIPAIDPITEFVLDGEGNPTEETNPEWQRVIQDEEERSVAQAVVDSATEETLALIEQRKSVEFA